MNWWSIGRSIHRCQMAINEILGSQILRTLLNIKPKIGFKIFLKSTFLFSFHKMSIFESKNTIGRSITTCPLSHLSQMLTSWQNFKPFLNRKVQYSYSSDYIDLVLECLKSCFEQESLKMYQNLQELLLLAAKEENYREVRIGWNPWILQGLSSVKRRMKKFLKASSKLLI